MFVKNQEQCRLKWKESKEECVRLKSELDKANSKITKLEKMLNSARISLDRERKNTIEARSERDELVIFFLFFQFSLDQLIYVKI